MFVKRFTKSIAIRENNNFSPIAIDSYFDILTFQEEAIQVKKTYERINQTDCRVCLALTRRAFRLPFA